jgi:hypothetical protein
MRIINNVFLEKNGFLCQSSIEYISIVFFGLFDYNVPILADLFGIFNVFIHLFPKQPGKN